MKTILVVEDERVIAEIISTVLEDEGYTVLIANNGQEGLERLAESIPDLVLCDVMMPIVDGRDMVRNMSEHPSYRSIPVIMMSAAAPPPGIQDYKYVAFVRKPFDIVHLVSTVERILQTT